MPVVKGKKYPYTAAGKKAAAKAKKARAAASPKSAASSTKVTEKIVIKKGAIKKIDTTVASGKSAKAVKKNKLAPTTKNARTMCNFRRLV